MDGHCLCWLWTGGARVVNVFPKHASPQCPQAGRGDEAREALLRLRGADEAAVEAEVASVRRAAESTTASDKAFMTILSSPR